MLRIEQFVSNAACNGPGLLVHFNIADLQRFNSHMGYQQGDQAVALAHASIRRLVGREADFARVSGDGWLALLGPGDLPAVDSLLTSFRHEYKLDIGWEVEGTRGGERARTRSTVPATMTRALRCAYGFVAGAEDMGTTAQLLVEENWGFAPTSAVALNDLQSLQRSAWQCVSAYPEAEPCCPLCQASRFDWDDGDGSVYGAHGECLACGALISVRGIDELR